MNGNLVLTRRPGETIHVDGPATFTIERFRRGGQQVVVSIQAERNVKILRGELAQAAEAKPDEREAA